MTRAQNLSQMMHKGEEILDGCKSGWSRATHEGQTDAPQCSKHGCQDERPYDDPFPASHPRSSSRCLKGAGVARAGGGKQSRHCPRAPSCRTHRGSGTLPGPDNVIVSRRCGDISCPLLGRETPRTHTLYLYFCLTSQCGPGHRNQIRPTELVAQVPRLLGGSQVT